MIPIHYAQAEAIATLLKSDKNTLLSSRGTVSFDTRTNTLLVQEVGEKLAQLRAVIQSLDVPVKQVMIESRIVFANEDFESELGLNLHPSGFGPVGISRFDCPLAPS